MTGTPAQERTAAVSAAAFLETASSITLVRICRIDWSNATQGLEVAIYHRTYPAPTTGRQRCNESLMTASTAASSRRIDEETEGGPQTIQLSGGKTLSYTEYGDPAGVPVVFLHGTPGSRLLGELFDQAANENGIRLFAFDRPGYGHSTPIAGRTVNETGTLVTTFLDHVGVDAAGLVAFSGGAPFALAAAAHSPERIQRVDIVAGATPPSAGDRPPFPQRILQGFASKTPSLLRLLFSGQRWLTARLPPSAVVSQYTTEGTEHVPSTAAEIVHRDFLEAFACSQQGVVTEFALASRDWHIPLTQIESPVCFRHGSRDVNVPVGGVRCLATELPTAELRVLDGADHLGTLLEERADILAHHR